METKNGTSRFCRTMMEAVFGGWPAYKMIFLSPLPVWYHRVLQSFIFSNKLLSNTTLGPWFLSKTQILDNHDNINVDKDVNNNVRHKEEYRRSPGGRTGNWMWSSTHPPANQSQKNLGSRVALVSGKFLHKFIIGWRMIVCLDYLKSAWMNWKISGWSLKCTVNLENVSR